MAKADHEIPYTIGDQERQVRIEEGIADIKDLLGNPLPRCAVNMEKITSLEKSRKNMKWLSGSVGIGLVLYTLKQIFNFILVKG